MAANAANSPTLTNRATQMGTILGTAAYMAPGQRAAGWSTSARTSGLGAVLFEMLVGRAAFAGDTVTDILAAVVSREPDWSALPRPRHPRSDGYWCVVWRRIRSAACAISATRGWIWSRVAAAGAAGAGRCCRLAAVELRAVAPCRGAGGGAGRIAGGRIRARD